METREQAFIQVFSISSKKQLEALLTSKDSFTRECAESKLRTIDKCIYSLDEI